MSVAEVIENYDYYEDDSDKETGEPQAAIKSVDARTRSTRDLDNNMNPDETITYKVCVR